MFKHLTPIEADSFIARVRRFLYRWAIDRFHRAFGKETDHPVQELHR